MTLNEDPVKRARQRTGNLSETVEELRAAFIAEAEAKDAVPQQQIEAHIAVSDAFVAKHGSLTDEFGTL